MSNDLMDIVIEQEETIKRLDGENFHLKRQLKNKNKTIKSLQYIINKLKDEKFDGKKDKYKNNRRGKRR